MLTLTIDQERTLEKTLGIMHSVDYSIITLEHETSIPLLTITNIELDFLLHILKAENFTLPQMQLQKLFPNNHDDITKRLAELQHITLQEDGSIVANCIIQPNYVSTQEESNTASENKEAPDAKDTLILTLQTKITDLQKEIEGHKKSKKRRNNEISDLNKELSTLRKTTRETETQNAIQQNIIATQKIHLAQSVEYFKKIAKRCDDVAGFIEEAQTNDLQFTRQALCESGVLKEETAESRETAVEQKNSAETQSNIGQTVTHLINDQSYYLSQTVSLWKQLAGNVRQNAAIIETQEVKDFKRLKTKP